jgi:hypothetical protein
MKTPGTYINTVGEKREEFVLTPHWLSLSLLALSSANATQTKARRQTSKFYPPRHTHKLLHEKAELMR